MPAVATGLQLHLGGFDIPCPYQALRWLGTFFRKKGQGRRSFWGDGFFRERLLRKAKCGTSLGSSGEERGENGKEALKKRFHFTLTRVASVRDALRG